MFKLLGGKLTLENIVLDGNAQWKDASSGLWYERTAQGTAASLPLIYAQAQVGGHPGSGSRLVLSSGCVIQNFYVNRAADNIDTDPVLGKYGCNHPWRRSEGQCSEIGRGVLPQCLWARNHLPGHHSGNELYD